MKKALFIIAGLAFLVACGGSNTESKQTQESETSTTEAAAPASDPEADRGMELIAKSDCLTCHKVADQSVGPAYEAVAGKYADDPVVIDTLAHKVIRGGSGNWGTTPMTPHPDLKVEDARAMVKYVLSLK